MRFDHWSLYWICFIVLFSLSTIFKPKRFAVLFLLVCVWTVNLTFYFDWSGLKLLLFFFLISLLLNNFKTGILSLPNYRALITFVLIFCIWSIFAAFRVPESELTQIVSSVAQKPPIRGIGRTAYFMSFILALPIAFWGITNIKDFSKVLRIFFYTAGIVAVIGIIEIFSFRFVPSLNSLWLFFNAENIFETVTGKVTLSSYRPCPFVLEPRYFGFAMGFTSCLCLLCKIFPIPGIPRWATSLPFISFCFLMSLASVSVSAISGTLSGILALMLWLTVNKRIFQKRLFKYIVSYLLLALLFLSTTNLLEHRFYSYLKGAGIMNQFDMIDVSLDTQDGRLSTNAYFYWLMDQPQYLIIGSGFGNGGFYSFDYLPAYSGFREAGFLSARLPIIDLISDIGIFGMLFLFGLWLRWWKRLKKLRKEFINVENINSLEIIRGILIFLVVSGFFFETYALTWFFFGAGFALAKKISTDMKSPAIKKTSFR